MASFLLPAVVLAALGALALGGEKKKPAPSPAPPGGGGGGAVPPLPLPGGGSMPLLSCDQAVTSLPPPMQSTVATMLSAPKTPENAAAARKMATVLESTAATSAPIEYRQPLLVAAQCLRVWADSVGAAPIGMPTPPNLPGGGGGPGGWPLPGGFGSDGGGAPSGAGDLSFPAGVIIDKNGVPSSWDGKAPMPGYQSNPLFQWVYTVANGDSPWLIATGAFGPTAPIARVVELIQNNPVEVLTGRKMQTKGDPMNPNTSGYNFVTLLPGDVLRIPKTWNAWIDQTGKTRGAAAPWPPPTSFP